MKVEILSLSVTFVYEFENYRSILIEQSIEVRGFDVLENACYRKSVVETQISQKMIPPPPPQKKALNLTKRVGIGSGYKQI